MLAYGKGVLQCKVACKGVIISAFDHRKHPRTLLLCVSVSFLRKQLVSNTFLNDYGQNYLWVISS